MAKPILYPKHAFDSNLETSFDYVYFGDQQFSNRLIIRNINDNSIVYQQTQTTFKLEHVLSAGMIQNGKSYTAEIIVYDRFNVPSETSDRIQFNTLTTPVFKISNLIQNQIIRNSNYELEIEYSQLQEELLNEYTVELFDLSHNLIDSSGSLFPINGMSYILTALLDNQGYYVRLTGITVSKMELISEEILFSVEYDSPSSYSRLILENIPGQASIKIQNNMILVDGKPNHNPVVYYDGKVDLSQEGKYIIYDDGFIIRDNFLIEIILENIPNNKVFFELSDGKSNIITVQKYYGNILNYNGIKEYFLLNVNNGVITYRVASNILDVITDEQIVLVIKRSGNLYSINASIHNSNIIDGGTPFDTYNMNVNKIFDGGNPNSIFDSTNGLEIDGGGV